MFSAASLHALVPPHIMNSDFTHVFVPKQAIASDEELDIVLKKFKITKKNLPLMKETDPVAVSLNAKAGDVIKCERMSQITGKESMYYRQVVEEV